MAKEKTSKYTCADFGLGELMFIPIDSDEHEPVHCYTTPSAVIRASRMSGDLAGFAVSYFSARSQGLFDVLGFEETGDIEEDVLNFFDRYTTSTADLLEGEHEETEDEQDPTK